MNIHETLDAIKSARSEALPDAVAKAFTQSQSATSGITAYSLEGPAKKLYPVPTLLRNLLGRVTGGQGIQANWRSVTAINTTNIFGGIGEGQRGAVQQQQTTDNLAAFRGIGIENSVTFEAEYAAEGFDDVKAMAVQQALEALMMVEEKLLLGGNTSMALGTTPTPTAVASTGGAIAAGTYNVAAVALTYQGQAISSMESGVVQTSTFTSADGGSIVQDGGCAAPSATVSVTTATTNLSVTATVPVLRGAFGYAWFIGAAGSEKLAAITSTNRVVLTALPGATQALSALVAADKSRNTLVFDGLLTQACQANSGAYFKALDADSGLTSDGAGGIVEIDAALKYHYEKFKLSPTKLFVSSQEMVQIKAKLLSVPSGAAVPAFRFNFETNKGAISGGAAVASYFNPFGSATGVPELEIVLHPYMPAGTMLFFSERLPYQMSNVGAVARVLCRRDYYQLEWPIRSRKWEYGVYADEVLQHYAPFSMGVITNIANK